MDHFEFSRKFFFHLQKLVLIIAHQDEIIDIDDKEKFDISDLHNVYAKIHITPHKFNAFQESIYFLVPSPRRLFQPV